MKRAHWSLLLLVIGAVIVLISAVVLWTRRTALPLAALPTAAVLPTAAALSPLPPRSIATATSAPSAAPPSQTATLIAWAAVTVPATTPPLSISQQTGMPAVLTRSPTQISTPDSGIPSPAAPTLAVQPSSTPLLPASAITPLPSGIPNTPRPTPADTIPLGSPAALDGGTLRLLQLYQPAEQLLRQMTGSVPPAPLGQQWVVVELLAICSDSAACVPDAAAFRLVSSSAEYAPTPLSALQPTFSAAALTFGQAWGYLTFALPADETALWMQLDLAGQRFTLGFAVP